MTRRAPSVQGRPPCLACKGQGWTVEIREVDWAEACARCGGTGVLPPPPTLHALATPLGEHPSALYRLDRLEVGQKVAWRLLTKIVRLISKNPELLESS